MPDSVEEVNDDFYTPEGPFPPESTQEITGLLSLGYLEKRVAFAGHTFVLRTLKSGEEIAVTLITKEYAETTGYAKAYALATVAASLELVDGKPLLAQLSPDVRVPIAQKFEVLSEWFWPTIEYLWTEYKALLETQIEAFKALQVKS